MTGHRDHHPHPGVSFESRLPMVDVTMPGVCWPVGGTLHLAVTRTIATNSTMAQRRRKLFQGMVLRQRRQQWQQQQQVFYPINNWYNNNLPYNKAKQKHWNEPFKPGSIRIIVSSVYSPFRHSIQLLSTHQWYYNNNKKNACQMPKSIQLDKADRTAAGLNAMGIEIDDCFKTWKFVGRRVPLSSSLSLFLSSTPSNIDVVDHLVVGGVPCQKCLWMFGSCNLVFQHLRDPISGCGADIFAAGETVRRTKTIGHKWNNYYNCIVDRCCKQHNLQSKLCRYDTFVFNVCRG
jgi:hypothetical protein